MTLSICGYLRISRTASPSPPPSTSTRRGAGIAAKPGMHQRFVIAVFVARAELQVTVEEQPQVVLESGQHDVLVARIARENDLVGIDVVFGGDGDPLASSMPPGRIASTQQHDTQRHAERARAN